MLVLHGFLMLGMALVYLILEEDKKKKQKQLPKPTAEELERYALEEENAELRYQLSLPPERRELSRFQDDPEPEPEPEPDFQSDEAMRLLATNPTLLAGVVALVAAARKTKKKDPDDDQTTKPTP